MPIAGTVTTAQLSATSGHTRAAPFQRPATAILMPMMNMPSIDSGQNVQMPELNGVEETRRLAAEAPTVGVVVLTMSEDDGTVFAAIRAGARGYLVKGAEQEEIVRAISTVASGGAVFGATLALRIAEFFAAGPPAPTVAFPQLTAREREILDLLAAGRSNGQIASALYLSPKTVRNNVSNVFAKLQVADRAEAIVRARDAGLGR
jgi:DNA-binding NarL/FixJ family response regulator